MYGHHGCRALSLFITHVLRPHTARTALQSAPPILVAELRCRILQGRLSPSGCRSVVTCQAVIRRRMEPESELLGVAEEGDASVTEGSAVIDLPDTKKAKKERLKRKKPKKTRKQKLKCSSSSINLLAELPFANAEVWKDLGFPTSEKSQRKKRKRKESEEDDEKKKKKTQTRPNYFVSIPITNPKITECIKSVQDLVVQKDHRLSRALVSVGSLHITLLVTYLGSEEEVSIAACAVAQMKPVLQDLLQGRALVLPFAGIGHFRNEVAFAQLAEGEHEQTLAEITEAVRKAFEEKGILCGDRKEFKPHLTFMKLSKAPRLRSQSVLHGCCVVTRSSQHRLSVRGSVSVAPGGSDPSLWCCRCVGEKKGAEPDDEELVSLSKRLVEDAVLKAVQQYMEETQHGGGGAAGESPLPPGGNLSK
ncbi:A-kinase anchor protein 7 [Arapaima gigas]